MAMPTLSCACQGRLRIPSSHFHTCSLFSTHLPSPQSVGSMQLKSGLLKQEQQDCKVFRSSTDSFQTSLSASSFHPHSLIFDGDSSSFSVHFVSLVPSSFGSHIQRHVARRLRRLKSCSVLAAHRHGRRRRASHVFTMRWQL
jgi:hypothetical protein